MRQTLRQAAAEYDPTGWWVGWAGPFTDWQAAADFAAVAGGEPSYCDRDGLPVGH